MLTRTAWRLVLNPPAPGAWNMAVDEAILDAVGSGEAQPTLRLYAWAPPCLSLGYAQPVSDVSMDALRAHGWQVVRRLTGLLSPDLLPEDYKKHLEEKYGRH